MIEVFHQVLKEYLNGFVEMCADSGSETTTELIISSDNRHYQVLEYGHTNARWVFIVLLHITIDDDGSILLLENATEEEPFDELLRKKIPYEMLKVGRIPPVIQAKLHEEAA